MKITYRREKEELEKLKAPATGNFSIIRARPVENGGNSEYLEWSEYYQFRRAGMYRVFDLTSCDYLERKEPRIELISVEEKKQLLKKSL